MRGKGRNWFSSSSFPPLGSCLQIFFSAKEGDEERGMWQEEGKGRAGLGVVVLEMCSPKGQGSHQATCPEGAPAGPQGT